VTFFVGLFVMWVVSLCLPQQNAYEIFIIPKPLAKLVLKRMSLLSLINLKSLYVGIACMSLLSIFFYETLFTKLGLQLPINPFEKEILNVMNVAPSQNHPNSWAFVWAFYILYTYFQFEPSANMFLYFFEYRISKWTSWASVRGVKGRGIWSLFQSFSKTFKGNFINIRKSNRNPNLLEGFPLYWSSQPESQLPRSPDDLDPNEMSDCQTLNNLGILFETSVLLKLSSQWS